MAEVPAKPQLAISDGVVALTGAVLPCEDLLLQLPCAGPEEALDFAVAALDPPALPRPATHASAKVWKAGDTVYQAGALLKSPSLSKMHHELPKTPTFLAVHYELHNTLQTLA